MDSLAGPNNSFGFRLFSQLHAVQPGENVLLSPLSVYLALAALHGGAVGQTRHELESALDLAGWPEDSLPDAVARLLAGFDPPPDPPEADNPVDTEAGRIRIIPVRRHYPIVRLATALWLQQGLKPAPTFVEVLSKAFRAQCAEIDFADPSAPATVNHWVREQTEGRIDHLVDRFDPLQLLCLATAFFFQGAWSTPFEPEHTTPQPFHGDIHTALVPMMRRDMVVAYADHPDAQLIALPYQGRDMQFVVILPEVHTSLASVVGMLDTATWDRWLAGLEPRLGTIAMPRFAVRSSPVMDLTTALTRLGLVHLTDRSGADLDGLLAEKPVPPMPVFLGQMVHAAMLAVDEAGTIAAAATAEILVGGIGVFDHSFTMIVDRPFLCAIRDRRSGAILFLAAIGDLTAT